VFRGEWTFARYDLNPEPRVIVLEEGTGRWLAQIEADARREMGTPQQAGQGEREPELRDLGRFLKRDGRFREIARTVVRPPEMTKGQAALAGLLAAVSSENPHAKTAEAESVMWTVMTCRRHTLPPEIELIVAQIASLRDRCAKDVILPYSAMTRHENATPTSIVGYCPPRMQF
jgi:hypothetical protein